MAGPTKTEGGTDLPKLGEEGDVCRECGSALAVDQRYCTSCGARRAGPRAAFERFLAPGQTSSAPAPAASRSDSAWSPITAVGAIAVLGIMLLLGVLIGKDDDSGKAAGTTTTVIQGTTTTDTTATVPATTTAPPATGVTESEGAAGQPAFGGAAGGATTTPTQPATKDSAGSRASGGECAGGSC